MQILGLLDMYFDGAEVFLSLLFSLALAILIILHSYGKILLALFVYRIL
jgi:hypothetical protein